MWRGWRGEPPRFATRAARQEHAVDMVKMLDDIFAQRDLADWKTILDAAGVTFEAAALVDEITDDAHLQQIGGLTPFADGKGLTISSPFHIDGETKVAPRRAPAVGQHSAEVLREAGYSPEDIARLQSLGVLA